MTPQALANIRPVAPHDLAPILRLISLVPQAPAWTVDDFRKLLEPTLQTAAASGLTRIAWVAEANAQLLGLAVLQCLQIEDISFTQTECELESILVHPDARRLGLGSELLSTAMRWCSERLATVVRLEVRVSNQAAIRLYERAGFTHTGTRPRYYAAPEEDALLMQYVGWPQGDMKG